jgi:ketosteroid isomerase-like protein
MVHTAPDEALIRALRARSNEAISRREIEGAVSVFREDGKILVAMGDLMEGTDSIRQYFERSFADPAFLAAARNPGQIHVSGSRAAEEGSWEAMWLPKINRGKYLARWERGPNGWSTVAEFYVLLTSDDIG